MKKIVSLAILAAGVLLCGCTGNTYSKLLKKEKKLISNYIDRNDIHTTGSEPEEYGEKDYYEVNGYDNLYFHLSEAGKGDSVIEGDVVLLRYRKYTLTAYADTISMWTTEELGYPIEFKLGDMNNPKACTAWHKAVQLMKYSGAEAKIICPSKLGFVEDNASVTPYGYDIKFTIKRY